nr:MAG TPA: hypothetical protein [Caudoviricetes sp.]
MSRAACVLGTCMRALFSTKNFSRFGVLGLASCGRGT